MQDSSDVTQILLDLRGGDDSATDRLLPVVYQELRRLAQSYLRKEPAGMSIQATDLVHEMYLKLVDQSRVDWQNRAHFFAVAATAMRRLLIDRARRRSRLKRGGNAQPVPLEDRQVADLAGPAEELLALDLALDKLGESHPQQARVVELKYFGGLKTREVAAVMDVGVRTVERYWLFARTWLFRELAAATATG